MAVSLVSEPVKTPEAIQCVSNAGRAQLPYRFLSTTPDEENYKVNIDILDELDAPYFSFTFRYAPKSSGDLFVDVSQALTELHERNGQNSLLYKLEFWETYTGFEGTKTKTTTIQSVYADRPIKSKGGSSLFQFLADETTKGKPLSLFLQPKAWRRWRRTSNVLVDPELLSRTTEFRMEADYLDATGNFISNSQTTTIPTDVGIYSTIVEDDATSTPANARFIRVKYLTTVGDLEVFNETLYTLESACDNPILIEWLNELGAWEQFVFDYSQDIQILTELGITAEKAITEDIADVSETKIRVADTYTQSILLQRDNLSLNELFALNDILKSSSVRILLDRKGLSFLKCVVVNTFSTQYTSSDNKHTFTMQLELPNNVNVFDLIDYEADTLGAHQDIAFTEGFN